MAVTTLDGLVAALTGGESLAFFKSAFTSEGAGTFHSLWAVAGCPGAGAAPGNTNGLIPTDATAGAFPFTNAGGAGNNYLGYIAAAASVSGSLIIYDRLYHSSGLSGTETANPTITPPALTRYTTGVGVELWVEFYSAIGATGATLTTTYTDQDGNTGASATYVHPANAETVGQMVPMTLASGDCGVRAVTAYDWSVSTGTAGNMGFTLVKRIVTLPLQTTNVAAVYDAFSSGLREVQDDACLAMMVQCSATTMGTINGDLTIAKA